MNRLLSFGLVTAALFLSAGNVQASIIASAKGDFAPGVNDGDPGIVSATGTGSWQYLASDTVNPAADPGLDFLLWNSLVGGGARYWNATSGGSANQVGVPNPGLASDELGIGASAFGRSPSYTVLRWISGVDEAGLIRISGNMRKITGYAAGDGMTLDIFVDGASVFSQVLAGTDTVGFGFDQNAVIGAGSTVDFVIGPNGSDAWDLPGFKATIEAVPEPAALLVWLVLAGVMVPLVSFRRALTASLVRAHR